MRFIALLLTLNVLAAAEFTVASYNCGGVTENYDYIYSAAISTIMQDRYIAEPELMSKNETAQKLALRLTFAPDSYDKSIAEQQWSLNGYDTLLKELEKTNPLWHQKMAEAVTDHKIRPVIVYDPLLKERLIQHTQELTGGNVNIGQARKIMGIRTFNHYLPFDIICFQEAKYINSSVLPKKYTYLVGTSKSKNGIAYNNERFELVEIIGDIAERAFAIKLKDKTTSKKILIASAHITGCHPYKIVIDEKGNLDSQKGDSELKAVIDRFESEKADFKLIAMDSNVTALHPRLNLVKQAGYQLDYENYLEPTCTNPIMVLPTRIDWIVLKNQTPAKVVNIPVSNVTLNSMENNMSDHRPIAAKVIY
jgi:hypothetical protein